MSVNLFKSTKVIIIRPIILSLTLGFIWALFVFSVSLIAFVTKETNDFIKLVNPLFQTNFLGLVLGFLWGALQGLIFGGIVGIIYRFLIKKKVEKVQDFVLDYDEEKKVNVIQHGTGDQPYTIVFVANPYIRIKDVSNGFENEGLELRKKHLNSLKKLLKKDSNKKDFEEIILDPIINNSDLFFHTIIRCLRSFVNNELLSLPEIFSRLRFVTIFNKNEHQKSDANALCEGINPFESILAPRLDNNDDVAAQKYLNNNISEDDVKELGIDNLINSIHKPDIIFVISGSRIFTRSSARFTEDSEDNASPQFQFTFSNKNLNDFETKFHSRCAEKPGVVALSALDDRLKTPVHEFAHAMSSLQNGAIVDEYVDQESLDVQTIFKEIAINKKYREPRNEPIPDIFAKYRFPIAQNNIVEYYSDRYRRDKGPGWVSYVPEGPKPGVSCIMDIVYFDFKFDKLIFDFMYDRLMSKLNR